MNEIRFSPTKKGENTVAKKVKLPLTGRVSCYYITGRLIG